MPQITQRLSFNGFDQKVIRLKLEPIMAEIEATLSGFPLLIEETRHANGTQGIRQAIDHEFSRHSGWKNIAVGGVDWTKTNADGRAVGVEVQVSGRSDLLAVDVMHLSEQLTDGSVECA
ncbi:hypothetical protein [Terricaulis silvestris]|uniref:Uncharacterized protein n=1 Tax=Terricaulis silvestris TaxID=2686094 RepID=A0A6I6MQH5_9CAUL|nr:hypothetical protein [Terricaulis silvestris]QGZ95668.1 hypothetical protein DSM104635_02518 [Terricaulis silvestris]